MKKIADGGLGHLLLGDDAADEGRGLGPGRGGLSGRCGEHFNLMLVLGAFTAVGSAVETMVRRENWDIELAGRSATNSRR